MTQLTLTSLDGSPQSVDSTAVQELQQHLRGQLLLPGDEKYENARRIWNGAHDKRPGLIVQCTGTADVIDAVNFARKYGLLVSIRGGGHNVAGTALCEGGLLIDLSLLREVHVHPDQRIADVGRYPG